MTPYVPPGALPFTTVLARLAEAWMSEAWNAAPARETAVLLGEDLHDFQRRSALRPGTLPDAIYARLRPMLVDGRVSALLHVQVGSPRDIPPASWQGDSAGDLRALLDGHVDFVLGDGVVERGNVLVAEDALVALLEGRAVPAPVGSHMAPVQAPEVSHIKGGNRPRPDADLFWIEVCRHVKDGGIPGSVTAFAEVMERWAAKNMRQPYEMETIRKKLGLMFRTIGWDDV